VHAVLLAAVEAANTSKSGSGLTSLLPFLLIILLAVFLFMRPNKKRQAQMRQLKTQVLPGAEVRTNAGLYGTVVSVTDDELVLEIAPGVRSRFDPRVVVAVTKPVDDRRAGVDAPGDAPVDAPADAPRSGGPTPVDATLDLPADDEVVAPATEVSGETRR
jgi:preprotein translocase subunit YajC